MNNETCVKELLNGLNMGMISIDHLIDKIENESLRELVLHQRKSYGDLKNKITSRYPSVEDITKQKMMLESMIEMKTVFTSDMKIAKMLSEGSLQSIMTMNHLLNKDDIDNDIKVYADEFEDISQSYIEELKKYL